MKATDKLLVILMAAILPACRQNPPPTRIVYTVEGVIQSVHPGKKEVVIQHERIPDFMDAMTMPFQVKNSKVLEGHKAGEAVYFQLVVAGNDAYVEAFVPKGKKGEVPSKPKPADNAGLVRVPQVGDEIPDLVLTNENKEKVRLRDYRGKILALNFIFTRCPIPTFCPRSMREFKSLKHQLGGRFGKDVEFFTITFDPRNDTPETMKSYRNTNHIAADHWQFLTGTPEEIKRTVSFFGLHYWTTPTGNILEHTMSTILVDREGKVARFYAGNQVSAKQILDDLEILLKN